MNALGAERLIRTLAVMQGPLASLVDTAAAAGPGTPAGVAGVGAAECQRAYERAKGYYTLITLPPEEIARLAADRPLRYSVAEWEALITVRVQGRPGDEGPTATAAAAALHRALDKAYNLSAGRKVGAALEELGSRVQAPVASLADSIKGGLKGGMLQARVLLKQAAQATTAAAHTVAEATTAAVQQAAEARNATAQSGGSSRGGGEASGSK